MISAGIVAGIVYADEVRKIVLNELNKHLLTEFQVGSVDFSVIRKFPFAALEFKEVLVKDSFKKNDTLLQASSVFLYFNLIDVLKGKYSLKKIQVKDAFANPIIDANGKENFEFWDSKPDKGEKAVSFSIEEVLLKNVNIHFIDLRHHHNISVKTEKSVLSGNFSSEKFTLKTALGFFADDITFNKITYVRKQPVKIALHLYVDKADSKYHFKKSDISIAGLRFLADGTIEKAPKGTEVNLSFIGNEISIKSLLSLLPEQFREYTEAYDSNGLFRVSGKVSGLANENSFPLIKADFEIGNGEFYHKKSKIKAEQIKLNGSFDSHTGNLSIPGFYCTLGSGEFEGKIHIRDLKNPQINLELVSKVELSEIYNLFPSENIENISGKVAIDASFSGQLKAQKDYTSDDFRLSKSWGKLNLVDVNVKLKENPHPYSNINAGLVFDNNDVIIQKFSGNYSGSDFELNGFFRNVFSWFFVEDENLVVDAKLTSKKINLNELLAGGGNTATDTSYKFSFGKNTSLFLNLSAGELEFRKFRAGNITGKITFKDNKLRLDGGRFSALEGDFTLSGSLGETENQNWKIDCDSYISNININSLFNQMENFGQEVLQDKHISGKATVSVKFSAVLNNNLEFDRKSLYCLANLLVEEGELKDFQPLMDLSAFIKVPDFKNVKFAAIKNEVEIKDEKIYLPKMDINSSAIDITISGVHGFNDEIDYRLRLLLSDILARKAKDNNKNNTEFGFVQDDERRKMSVFVAMKGTVKKPKISYDGIGLREKVKQDVQAEKQTVKSILKDEFGAYKSDSTLKSPSKAKQVNHQVEWDEFDKKEENKEKPKPSLEPEKKEKGKFGKWLDKVGNE